MSDVNITVSGQTYSPSSSGLMVPQNYKQQEVSQKRQMHAVEKIVKQNQVAQQTQRKSLLKTAGISFSVASVLKQSQIFTGVIGTIFQLIGALVDVILAPFLPIVVPILKLIGRWIPKIGDTIQNLVDWVIKIWDNIVGFFAKKDIDLIEAIKNNGVAIGLVGTVIAARFGLISRAWKLIPGFIRKPLEFVGRKWLLPISKKIGEMVLKLSPILAKFLKPAAVPAAKGAATVAKVAATQTGKVVAKAAATQTAKTLAQRFPKITAGITKTVGGIAKAAGLAKTGVTKGLGKYGAKVGQVMRAGAAIPVLGAVVEGAYGLYKTIDDFRDVRKAGGSFMQALGVSGARGAASVGLTAFAAGDASGIASALTSLGSHIALDINKQRVINNIQLNTNVTTPDAYTTVTTEAQQQEDVGIIEKFTNMIPGF